VGWIAGATHLTVSINGDVLTGEVTLCWPRHGVKDQRAERASGNIAWNFGELRTWQRWSEARRTGFRHLGGCSLAGTASGSVRCGNRRVAVC
jgi:hypothetical protein